MSEKIENAPVAVVTGANGFVGSHLVELLLNEGYRVQCIVRKTSNLRWVKDLNVEFHDCGLTDVDALKGVFEDANYIFHIAGVIAAKKPELFYEGNVETTRNVLEAAKGNPNIRKIVITSSLSASRSTVKGKPATEDMPSAPATNYGRSKVEQEQLAKTYMSDLPITIIRPPVVYGPRDTEVLLLFKTLQKRLMAMVGFSEKYYSLVYVDDLINGMLLAATSDKTIGQMYFLGPAQAEYAYSELCLKVADLLDVKPFKIRLPHALMYIVGGISQFFGRFGEKAPTLSFEKAREMTRASWSCSSEKAMREFGYAPAMSLEEGLKQTIEWYREQKWL